MTLKFLFPLLLLFLLPLLPSLPPLLQYKTIFLSLQKEKG